MRRENDFVQRVRRLGIVAGILALMAIGIVVLAANRSVGFVQSVTRRQEALLLALARRRKRQNWFSHDDQAPSTTPGAKK